jgi:hypothetical protein
VRAEAAEGDRAAAEYWRRRQVRNRIEHVEREVRSGHPQHALAVEAFLIGGHDGIVADDVIEAVDSRRREHVEPADDHRRRAQHEQPEAPRVAVAVEVHEDVDAEARDIVGQTVVRRAGDVVHVISRKIAIARGLAGRLAVDEEVDVEALTVVMVDGSEHRFHPVAVAEERRDVTDPQLAP